MKKSNTDVEKIFNRWDEEERELEKEKERKTFRQMGVETGRFSSTMNGKFKKALHFGIMYGTGVDKLNKL